MRGGGSWAARTLRAIAAVGVLAATSAVGVGGTSAAAPAPAAPGWTAGTIRVEPVDPGVTLNVAGVGDYRGAFELNGRGGGVNVINDVGLEEYVKGISEIPTSWPPEAQKAQAVAARTYALHEAARPSSGAFRAAGADICATESCQVYAGLAKELRPGAEAWNAAVDATAGQVLLYKGAPILAQYSSSNGGRSLAGSQPYLRAINDPDDRVSPLHRWRSPVALTDLARVFATPAPVVEASRTGDTVILTWLAEDGTPGAMHVAPLDFRSRLNATVAPAGGLPRPVPSHLFSVVSDSETGTAVLEGRGFGHAIGMSQYGALGKALRGMKAPDILAAYYAGLRPTPAPAATTPPTVRVALDLGRAEATVSGTGRFRVLDEAGKPLAVVATGTWKVVPAAGGKVRLVPPPAQAGPPAIQPLGVAPTQPAPGGPVEVSFALTAPAVVRVRAQAPTGPALVIERGAMDAGPITQALPPALMAGEYAVTVEADAGGGRSTSAALTFVVAKPTPPAVTGPPRPRLATASTPRPSGPGALRVVALAALLSVAGAAGSALRTSRR